jgi:imidazolonepropionase-like amidohydrolase
MDAATSIARLTLLLAVTWLCGSCGTPGASGRRGAPPAPRTIAFLHAAVVPMDAERVLRDHTVVVVDGRIVQVGPTSSVSVPPDAERIDARGRYLLPGLCDMHVHLLGDAWKMMLSPEAQARSAELPVESFLFPYVAEGVTTVQSMAATPEEIALRRRIERGEILGPRIVLARMIDGPRKAWPPPLSTWVESAEEARVAVREAKAAGYDKIKVYSFLSREAYDAIVSTARELGMDVIGHVPMSLSVEDTLDAGQKLIAHSEELSKHARGHYDPERVERDARIMASRGVWMTPTLVTTRSILEFFDDPGSIFARPGAIYFGHPMQRGVWSFMAEKLYAPISTAARQELRDAFWRYQRPLTRAFHDAGGKLMAGSDTMMIGLYPGFALHGELRELVEVGLTPYEALWTSTTAPFEYLGESGEAGTIAVGKRTDLLLVDANPLEDVSAASRISGVLIRGRWIPKEEIEARMRQLAGG